MRKVLIFLATSVLITFGIALALIASQRPGAVPAGAGLDFTRTLAGSTEPEMPGDSVTMRDGFALQVRRYPGPGPEAPLIVLVHGSGWHGLQFDGLAQNLAARAHVVAPDLRGHGAAPVRRDDLDYVGQFEDDLADLIAAEAGAGQKVILAGHSSGGGLVVRFAGGAHGDDLDGAVLLAPYLRHNAPATRPNSGGWAQPLTRRIIGLAVLNTFRITALNHLTAIQFRMPQSVLDGPLGHTATTAYSYRLNTAFAPRADYLADAAALPPFLLIAGAEDEAFVATAYEPTLSAATSKGRYHVLSGVGHLDVVNDPRTAALIMDFADEF